MIRFEHFILLVVFGYFLASAFEPSFGDDKKGFYHTYGGTEVQLLSSDGKPVPNAEFRIELIVAERKTFCHSGFQLASANSGVPKSDSDCMKYSYLSDHSISDEKGIAKFEGGFWSMDKAQESPVVVRVSGGKIDVPGCGTPLILEAPESRVVGKQLKQEVAAQEGCRFTYQLDGADNESASRNKVLQCKFPNLSASEIHARVANYRKTCHKVENDEG